MHPRSTSFTAIAALLATLSLAGCAEPPPRGVLLVSIDSLRADRLSCYGYRSPTRPDLPTSPTIDGRLAARGVLFERAYSTTSWTLPAHAAMLTGLADQVHGVRGIPDRLHPSRPYLPELLRDAGWRTFGVFSGPNLHPFFGFGRGFERYLDRSSARVGDARVFATEGPVRDDPELVALYREAHRGRTGPAVASAFVEWLGTLEAGERFFAFAHLWDVHYDYTPPPEHDLFDPAYEGTVDGTGIDALAREPELAAALEERDRLHLGALYDGELHATDADVGTLLDALEASGRAEDTLVLLTADHGEEFGEHGGLGHARTLFEEVVRVPLVARLPGRFPEGARRAAPVSLVDIAPTILEFAGLPVPPELQGRSLLALAAEGTAPPERLLPLELTRGSARVQMRGAHAGDHKVLRELPASRPVVHDLGRDPSELDPRMPPRSDPRVSRAIELWRSLDERARLLAPPDRGDVPDELRAELERLGYLDPADDS